MNVTVLRFLFALTFVSLVGVGIAHAQLRSSVSPLTGVLEKQSATTVRVPSLNTTLDGLTILPAEFGLYYNSARAWGPNLGPVWLGRGITNSISLGARFKHTILDVQVRPVYLYSQNRDFLSPHGIYDGNEQLIFNEIDGDIDLPYRINDGSFTDLFPGDSWVKVNLWNLSAGLSTENLWWGPGKRTSLLMSNNAPGFPHLSFQTTKPINIWIADVHTSIAVGVLQESYVLDDIRTTFDVIFNGIIIQMRPRFDKNLSVGAIRTFILNDEYATSIFDYFPLFQPLLKTSLPVGFYNGRGNLPDDQRFSVFLNWEFPAAGLSVYGEYGRDDHFADYRDLYLQPNHLRAYSIGFQKKWDNKLGTWGLNAEYSTTITTNTKIVRGYEIFYSHRRVTRGYTNQGQYLGSYYGMGGEGIYLGLQNKYKNLSTGIQLERVSKNTDFYYAIREFSRTAQPDIDTVVGFMGKYDMDQISIRSELNFVRTRNGYHRQIGAAGDRSYFEPRNINLQLTVSYNFNWSRN